MPPGPAGTFKGLVLEASPGSLLGHSALPFTVRLLETEIVTTGESARTTEVLLGLLRLMVPEEM